MKTAEPGPAGRHDLGELYSALDQLAWSSARQIWPGPGEPPASLCDRGVSRDQARTGHLALLSVLTDMLSHVQAGVSAEASGALSAGVGPATSPQSWVSPARPLRSAGDQSRRASGWRW
jgi:hypothetical protein